MSCDIRQTPLHIHSSSDSSLFVKWLGLACKTRTSITGKGLEIANRVRHSLLSVYLPSTWCFKRPSSHQFKWSNVWNHCLGCDYSYSDSERILDTKHLGSFVHLAWCCESCPHSRFMGTTPPTHACAICYQSTCNVKIEKGVSDSKLHLGAAGHVTGCPVAWLVSYVAAW